MCGIFAWAGKTPNQFNKAKLDILGFYNIERGKHSCGVTTDGDIFLGVDSNKLYSEFLANSNYDTPKKYPIVIGHTRHATGGAHNTDNAHPFGFGKLKDHYRFIGVHNGSLTNHSALAKENKIEETIKTTNKNVISYRTKIDSEILLEILYRKASLKVLNEYDGAAALMFTDIKEPNILYCYHGKSRKHEGVGDPEEERPLYYWQEKRNSVFISSIPKSLHAIGAEGDQVVQFDHNIVYKIEDGNVSTSTKSIINRDDRIQTTRYRSSRKSYNDTNSCSTENNAYKRNKIGTEIANRYNNAKKDKDVIQLPFSFGPTADFNIYNDQPIGGQNAQENKVYVNKLRYWRTGHTINGVYTWIPKYGFFFLGDKIKEAENRFYDFVNKYFWKDDFIRTITDVPKKNRNEMFIPFFSDKDNEITYPQLYYFFHGIRVKTAADFNACISGIPQFNWEALSMCSAHPIVNINYRKKPDNDQGIILDGAPVTDTISLLGSNKIYNIKDGNCIGIKLQQQVDTESVKKIDEVVKSIMTQEKEILKKELIVREKTVTAQNDDLLDKDLDDMFKDSLYKFPSFSKKLADYQSPRAKQGKEILDVFIEGATNLMRVDIND
jgi:predicted glutamine amidotransferase